MARKAIPTVSRNKVLREFNHRCSICGADKPHIHHIDENPENNAIENLLPLCPNCHLIDHHDPTSSADPQKLSMFRHYKDPVILSPQFSPLFKRVRFLLNLEEADFETRLAIAQTKELVEFVMQLQMGTFYGDKIRSLTRVPTIARVFTPDTPDYVFKKWDEEKRIKYFQRLTSSSCDILDLVIELLRYQPWRPA